MRGRSIDEGLERASIDADVNRIACRLSLSSAQTAKPNFCWPIPPSDKRPSHVTLTLFEQHYSHISCTTTAIHNYSCSLCVISLLQLHVLLVEPFWSLCDNLKFQYRLASTSLTRLHVPPRFTRLPQIRGFQLPALHLQRITSELASPLLRAQWHMKMSDSEDDRPLMKGMSQSRIQSLSASPLQDSTSSSLELQVVEPYHSLIHSLTHLLTLLPKCLC